MREKFWEVSVLVAAGTIAVIQFLFLYFFLN
jgi:hypothetical protein